MKTYAAKPLTLCIKKRYRDKEIAEAVLNRIHRLNTPGHQERRAYQCPDCNNEWHLTSIEVVPWWAQRGETA